ncbi:MAG: glycosyltransferase family 4 protein [Candidatus Cryosericum sp.]
MMLHDKLNAAKTSIAGDEYDRNVAIEGASVLFVATVDSHIWYFHMAHMQLLRDMGYAVEVAAAPAGFAEEIRGEGYEVHSIPFSRNPLNMRNILAYSTLRKLMRSKHYIMVHVHTPVAGFLGRLAARRQGVSHIVYTAHGFHFHRYGMWWSNCLYYTLERIGARWTDVLITINREDFAAASSRLVRGRTKVVYVPGVGVDCRKFQVPSTAEHVNARASLEFSQNSCAIVWVGELNRNKRPQDALVALSRLCETTSAQMVMLGNGKRAQEMRNLAAQYGLGEIVRLLGRVTNVAEYLSASDVFVSTSMREGLPRSILEAMATGLPVVAYDIRGCNDLVVDGETGFLVPFGDVHGLADKLAWLARHPDERHRMGEAGRERIMEKFSLAAVLPKLKTVYQDELARKGERQP